MGIALTSITGVSILWIITFIRICTTKLTRRELGIRSAYHNLTSVLVPLAWGMFTGAYHVQLLIFLCHSLASGMAIIEERSKVVGKGRRKVKVNSPTAQAHYVSIILLWGLSIAVEFLTHT